MKNQFNLLSLNRRRAGAVVKLAWALVTATAAVCAATDPDGVTLISQATVQAAGGFPHQITQPGSYRLTSNLIANTTALSITAVDVTLDLNGFRVACTCAGHPGIVSLESGTTIRNGSVEGYRDLSGSGLGYGIHFTSTRARVDHVTVFNNGYGIYVDNGDLVVTDSTVSGCEDNGIYSAGGMLTVSNSNISGSPGGYGGITVGGFGLVTGNMIAGNAIGITVLYGSTGATVTNNAILGNGIGIISHNTTGIGSNTFAGVGSNWVGAPAISMKNNVCGGTVC